MAAKKRHPIDEPPEDEWQGSHDLIEVVPQPDPSPLEPLREALASVLPKDPVEEIRQATVMVENVRMLLHSRFGEGWQPVAALAAARDRLARAYAHLCELAGRKHG